MANHLVKGRPSKYGAIIEKAIDEYIKNMIAIGRANSTVVRVAATLNDFYHFYMEEYVGDSKKNKWNYSEPSFSTVTAWRESLRDRGLAASTIAKYLNRLHTFFEFASDPEIGFYKKNPVSPRAIPDISKEMKRPYELPLTNDQISLLWSSERPVTERGAARLWEKTYAIVMLLITSKIRNAELLALTPNDLDWEYGEISVNHGKGNKYRTAPFTEIAQQAVKMYLASGLRPASATDEDPLFLSYYGKGFGNRTMTDSFHGCCSQWLSKTVEHHVYLVTGVHDVRSHDLRHLGAYIDLNTGKPIEELQAELGHSSPTTTQIYSGRLTGRRNRGSIKLAMEEQAYQIERNNAILQAKAV